MVSFYTHSMPKLLKLWHGNQTLWQVTTTEKELYLTFDDGPTPEVTSGVLALLAKYNAKATFFCLGKNVEANPTLFNDILYQGHSVGNHTYNHVKGINTNTNEYMADVAKAAPYIKSNLFRPPYGQVKRSQVKALTNLGYKVVFWNVLSGDFDPNLNSNKALNQCIKRSKPGSILVFHDSLKAAINLNAMLPSYLDAMANQGYVFKALPN